MYSYTKAATLSAVILSLTACATSSVQESDKAPYFESSYNDRNRAPASFAPSSVAIDDKGSLDPVYLQTQADYHFAMGEAYALEGNSLKALEAFKMVLIYDQKSPTVHLRLAGEYLKQGMATEALDQVKEAVKKDPKNADAHILLGGLYSSMKLYDKADEAYQTSLKLSPENFESLLYLGALYSEQSKPDKAIHYFSRLAKSTDYPSPHLAYYYMGRVRLEQADAKYYGEAEKSFKKSLEVRPNFADAVLSLGVIYSRQKQEAKAIELYRNFQKEQTPNPRIAEVLAQVFIEQGNYDQAYTQLEVMEASSNEPLAIRLKMAMIFIEQKKYDQAEAKLADILRDAPESDKVRFYLAAVYEETKKFEKALVEYKKIPAGSTFYTESVVHSAYILKELGRYSEGIEVASQGIQKKAESPQLYGIYASLLDENKDTKGALEVLKKAVIKYPDSAQLLFYRGTVYDKLGKKEQVVSDMKKVLEIEPTHTQGMNYLAFTWAEMGENLPEAEKLARKALESDPQDGYILDTLGWVLYKQDKYVDAIKYLEVAVKKQPSVSIIAEHLGDAYYKKSMLAKAKQMYKRAAELETDLKKAGEIKNKITAIEHQEFRPEGRLPAAALVTEQ